MKSSIRGKRYLDYLWELGELPAYIISGFGVLWESEVRWSGHGKNSGDLQEYWFYYEKMQVNVYYAPEK